MKVIIAGSRGIVDMDIDAVIKQSGFAITEVVSGGAVGVDELGELWARQHNIPVKLFAANWAAYGKSAGPRRNSEMAEYADALIAVPTISSKGTHDMIRKAKAKRLKVYVHV